MSHHGCIIISADDVVSDIRHGEGVGNRESADGSALEMKSFNADLVPAYFI
jgi:hypothetical protein